MTDETRQALEVIARVLTEKSRDAETTPTTDRPPYERGYFVGLWHGYNDAALMLYSALGDEAGAEGD